MGNVLIDGFELSEDNFGNLMVFAAGGVGSDSYEMICREDKRAEEVIDDKY